ncbi:MAG: FAD-dependent oxidoreductase [Thermoguttaceae bacterium]
MSSPTRRACACTHRDLPEDGKASASTHPAGREETKRTLGIVGGGLAGLAAAVEAVERGWRVDLFEQAPFLGGRAGSLVDSRTGQLIDYCQHVAMGCCSRFLEFCRRTGIADCFQSAGALHFIGPDGKQCDVAASRWLPAPLHLLPGLMRLKYLTLGERWAIATAMRRLVRGQRDAALSLPDATLGDWLRTQHQSAHAIEGFWSVVIESALGETVDHASAAAARQVFRDGFMLSRQAGDVLLPRLPLRQIFHDRLLPWLANRGVQIHLATRVRSIEGTASSAQTLVLDGGVRKTFDQLVVAVPWHALGPLLAGELSLPSHFGIGAGGDGRDATGPHPNPLPKGEGTVMTGPHPNALPTGGRTEIERIEPAAITGIHLWFDRPVVPLPHAVLVGRLGQWVFADSVSRLPKGEGTAAQHCQVVISASHRLPRRSHDEWLAAIADELRSTWPTAAAAKLLHGRVVTQPAALFSAQPGVDRDRPPQQTAIANLALAGDWTATGWPATMESAVRSGRLAVEALDGS